MNPKEEIKAIMKNEGKTQTYIARKIGVPPSTINIKLNGLNSISFSSVEEMVNALDYEVVIVPDTPADKDTTINPIYNLKDASLLTDSDLEIIRYAAEMFIAERKAGPK